MRYEANLEYDKALSIVEQLIAGGLHTDRAQLAELHFYAGKLAAGLERTDVAIDHFARSLALVPDRALPAGTSPKIAAPFEAARARTMPLQIEIAHTAPGQLAATVSGDRLKLAASATARFIDPLGNVHVLAVRDAEEDVTGNIRVFRILVPPGTKQTTVAVVDEHGNQLAQETLPEPVPEKHYDETWTLHHHEPSLIARWPTWGAVSVLALAGGGLCAWRFSVAQDEWNTLRAHDGQHDYSQLTAVEDRGRRWGIAADVGFGLAGAAAITAAILAVVHHGDDRIAITAGARSLGVAARF